MAETLEVLHRSWHVEGQSVRPDHRMVAHTGFLTSARLLGATGPGRLDEGRPARRTPPASWNSDSESENRAGGEGRRRGLWTRST